MDTTTTTAIKVVIAQSMVKEKKRCEASQKKQDRALAVRARRKASVCTSSLPNALIGDRPLSDAVTTDKTVLRVTPSSRFNSLIV
mmetsp:Transcript_17751/g.54203  ORF Transcript_17751/g.54203 Transcript_17751/m.54203 type:complete len:85 (+) Transcript_17751:482-736(+)